MSETSPFATGKPAPRLPTPTPEQATLGRQLYREFFMLIQSYELWFCEGVPSEWLRALEEIRQALLRSKRVALVAAKAQEDTP
jgi:hypothetical protein